MERDQAEKPDSAMEIGIEAITTGRPLPGSPEEILENHEPAI